MWNLNYGTNELICKTEIDRLTKKTDFPLPRGLGRFGSLGSANANKVYIGWMDNKVLLYSTGSYFQYSTINHNGKEYAYEETKVTRIYLI